MNDITIFQQFSIIGFGNQAKAWAMNLRDSGIEISIGLRKNSSSYQAAEKMGFQTFCFENEPIKSEAFALLTPDDTHSNILESIINFNKNKICLYAHGFSFNQGNFAKTFPSIEHILLAPKSIASELRFNYETNNNLVGIYSLEGAQKLDEVTLKSFAQKLGLKSIYNASFKEETNADLFSEQSILCALLPYGALTTFNTLRNKGYPKELAFFECFYEIKLIADTLLKVGPQKFFDLISPNALIGSEKGQKLLFDQSFQNKLDTLLKEIENKNFEEEIEKTDIVALRQKINQTWSSEELSKVYDQLKDYI